MHDVFLINVDVEAREQLVLVDLDAVAGETVQSVQRVCFQLPRFVQQMLSVSFNSKVIAWRHTQTNARRSDYST